MSLLIVGQPSVRPYGSRRALTMLAIAVAFCVSWVSPHLLKSFIERCVHGMPPSTREQVESARASVCSLSARCAGQGCLQRSVATLMLCRFEGHCPTWKSGYQIRPFRAHAWVEADGFPVAEPLEVGSYVTVLEVVPSVGKERAA